MYLAHMSPDERPTSAEHRSSHAARYRQIAHTLARHGLGYSLDVLGLEQFVPLHTGFLGHARRADPYTRPEYVRMALAELGTTFIKLGQILSTRPDLVPREYQVELAKLQDQAPQVPVDEILEVLQTEFGRPVDDVFATFDTEPLAAASIGQVHAASLADGTEVVVKVRRPGVVEQVDEDLEILQNLAAVASRRSELADQYDLVGLAQEFAQSLRSELDYLNEGRNAERFAENFADSSDVHIPRVFWDTTTSRALTLERVRGVKISDGAALEAAGIDRPSLAQRSADILVKMVLDDGFFHADPHPGNFFVESDSRLGLIDFGLVGSLDERTQDRLVGLLLAISSKDADQLVDAVLDLGVARQRVDRAQLRRDLERLMSRYYNTPIGDIALGPLIEEAQDVVRQHHLQVPSEFALLLKTAVMSEGLGVQLDPNFQLTAVVVPHAQRLLVRQYSPVRLAERVGKASVDAARLAMELPRQLRRLLADLERGDLEFAMRPSGFDPLLHQLERLVNRLVLGMLAASFIVGLAVLGAVYRPPGWEQLTGVAFAVGFTIAAAIGIYLAISIARSGRL
jgi:ubiquinone biosynthesis protein